MKIKHTNLEKIFKSCTGKEIDLLLEIAQFQNAHGVIEGIDYKTIIKSIGINKSTFFKLLVSLEEKGIIQVNQLNENYGFWTITLIDNVFEGSTDYKSGYLNINKTLLHSEQFHGLKRAEKVIILNLFKIKNKRKSISITLDTLKKWTGSKLQSIRHYIKTLSKIFEIGRTGNTFTFTSSIWFTLKSDEEKNIRNKHLINYLAKKNKITADQEEVEEVAALFTQYPKTAPTLILEVIENSIQQIQKVNVKYIHKYLINILKRKKN